jgi:short-subunit dehydrogenase
MTRTGKTALVTGASVGLGAEFARLFATDGHDVVLVARRRDKLEALGAELEAKHGVRAVAMPDDLGDREAPVRIVRELEKRSIAVEFLVNNAGFGSNGAFAELELGRELEMVQVNVVALVHLTRLLLPPMIGRGSGRILNLGSTAGFAPGPFMADYYASKAFVNSFSQALWYELRGTGVTVTVSCPGATATEFSQVAGNDKSRLFKAGAMGATEVATHAYRAMMRGKRMAIPGVRNKLLLQSLRVSPASVSIGVAGALNRTNDAKALPPR